MTHASRSANQRKTEPFPAGPSEGQAETPGADDPQAPGTSEQMQPVQGVHTPEVEEPEPRT